MADYIKYDVITGRILDKYKSNDGSNLTGNILKIDRATFDALTIYQKVVADKVTDMTQAEIDALDAEITQTVENNLIANIEKYKVTTLQMITALVKVINVRIPANPITKAEMIAQLRSDLGV